MGEEEGDRPYSLSKPLKPQLANYSPTISIFENQQKAGFFNGKSSTRSNSCEKATIFRRVFCQPMNDFIDFSHCEPYDVSPQRPYSLHIRSVAHALPRSVTKPGNKKCPFPSERPCYGKLSTCRETVARKMPENILN